MIPAGQSAVTITVTPIKDRAVEPIETIILTAASQPAYKVGNPTGATVYLFDDDALFAFLARLRDGS